ncbi:MAG: tetratricopeptide repeat protein, partial [Planctomycetota bacterium]
MGIIRDLPGAASRTCLPSRRPAWSVLLAACALAARASTAGEAPGDLAAARRGYLSGNYEEAEKALRALAGAGAPEARSSGARSTLARLLLETGRTKEAAEVASKLRKEHPKDARWAVLAGELALAAGKAREAEDSFVEALKLDPEGRRARIFLKRIYDLTGRDKESRGIVDYFWDFNNEKLAGSRSPDPADFMYVAEAVRDYDAEAKKVAFRHFRRAYAGDPNIPAYKPDPDIHEAYIGAGELALEVYDWSRARREFGALLKRNPHHPVAHLGLARLHLAASDNKKAEEEAKKALEANPKLIGAHLVLAQLHMVDDRMDEARREIDAALGANPVDPDAMAMDATWRFASGDEAGFESIVKRGLALYPRHFGFYAGVASVLERRRRFPEALAQHRKVAELDPGGWEGHYGVGMTLVRMGEERAGYKALETAFERNPFNVWAYNTLVALDRDFKEGALVRRETEHWVIKLTKEEEPVLAEQVEELLEELWDEETRRFGFTPRGPDETKRKVLFEMFAEHEDFSSRTAGIPNLGALGATLGQIVTMPSPSWGAGEGKPFRWTEVARHEFVHVITLQMT